MTRVGVWDLSDLQADQVAITRSAIEAVQGFDWNLLVPGLQEAVGRDYIPVVWEDLSRWQTAAETSLESFEERVEEARTAQARAHDEHEHDHPVAPDPEPEPGLLHWHVKDDDGGEGHVLAAMFEGRAQALGLAWYSGKVSIDQRLVNNPDLAREVFLAEGAHMIDFFYMTPEQRQEIFDAYHSTPEGQDTADHGHGWFEETGNHDYWSWVGESFMSGFIVAYAPALPMPLEPRQPWAHRTTPAIADRIRALLTPEPVNPEPVPEEPVVEEPTVAHRYFADSKGEVYHDRHNHPNISADVFFDSIEEAEAAGLRPCEVCDPKP